MQAQLQNLYADYAAHLPGQHLPWLKSLRDQAFAQFTEQGVPSIRTEAWKYTNLHRVANQLYSLSLAANTKVQLESIPIFADSMRLVFIDGIFAPHLSKQQSASGVHYQSLAAASLQPTALLTGNLQQAIVEATSAFPALNISMALDGAVIEIAENANVGVIELVFYTTAQTERTLVQPRNLIVSGANSNAIILEHYLGQENAQSFTNAVTEVQLGRGATLQHIKLQMEPAQTDHIGQLFVKQQAESRFSSVVLSYGGNLVRNEIQTLFAEEHSQTELGGLFLARHNQLMDQYTLIDHSASHCTSQELYRGILLDNARGVFNGRIIVQPHAQKTNAKQINNNLLLSNTAEIDTKPELQIYNDDVQCVHAATVGQLDPQALFYLRARGLSQAKAQEMLLFAFANQILDKVKHENIRTQLQEQLSTILS